MGQLVRISGLGWKSQETNLLLHLIEGAFWGIGGSHVLGKFPGFHKDGTQLRLQAKVKRVTDLTSLFPYNQINYHPTCHHRTFIQKLMKADAEIHSHALGQAPSTVKERGKGLYERGS